LQIQSVAGHQLSVGKYGESAAFIFASEYRETPINNEAIVLQSSDGREYRTLQFQLPLWMARIFPGFDVESEIYARADQVRLGLAVQRQSTGQPLFVRPTNTGFGISFILGVVVAGLVAESNTLLCIENPEAHLHPKAQSIVGEFLGRVAAGGAQVILETHSEHVVNGLRRLVKQTVLESSNLQLFFFSKDESVEPNVVPISVTKDAQLSAWPDGFMDQLDSDLNAILS
jgi:predicted ATPase